MTRAAIARLDALLADPTIEELWVNAPDRIFVARDGLPELTRCTVTSADISLWVERLLMHSQRRLDLSSPFVDATLSDGSRLHVAIPDVVQTNWSINIRKFMTKLNSLEQLVLRGVLNEQISILLEAAVISGYNIVVAGGTGTGKTTMLNCLIAAVPASERIITCEEVFELSIGHMDHVALQTRASSLEGTGQVSVRELVRQSLRMRPQRLIVGEVREAESLDLLLALNSGQPGMATVHANSAREAILKLCTLPLLAGENVTSDFVVPTVAAAVDLIVHVTRDAKGVRRIHEIAATTGEVVDNRPELQPLVRWNGTAWEVLSTHLPKSLIRNTNVDAAALWAAVA
jgi:pilus assembly protein CpaF